MDGKHVISDASPDQPSDAEQDIEVFAQMVLEYATRAVDEDTIAPSYVPEALLLAAVELGARHEDNPDGVPTWLERVAGRLRGHVEPVVSSVQ